MNNNRGFTLFEVLIALSITTIFFLMIASITLSSQSNYTIAINRNEVNNEISRIIRVVDQTIDSYNDIGTSLVFEGGVIKTTEGQNILFYDAEESFLYFRDNPLEELKRYPLFNVIYIEFQPVGNVFVFHIETESRTVRKVYIVIGGLT